MLANPKPLSQIQISLEFAGMYDTILTPWEANEHDTSLKICISTVAD